MPGLDVLDFSALRHVIEAERPSAIVNCVGVIKQLKSANDRRLAVGINAYLPHVLQKMSDDIGARFVHFSTDCVFSGRKGHYREEDISDAEDIYGRTKFLGEIDADEGRGVTLRTSIIGRELKTTHGLVEWFLSQKGNHIRGYHGAIYTGFPTAEMAGIIMRVLEQGESLRGVYQIASNPITKFDLLTAIRDLGGFDIIIDRDETFQCDRSLVMERFTASTGYFAPSWREMISVMLADSTPYDQYRRSRDA